MNTSVSALDTVFISFLTAVASAVVIYFATRSKARLDMTIEYDRALHERRLELYKKLWPMTAPLGRYGTPESYTYQSIENVHLQTSQWYFEEGGLFLSKRSRDPYFRVKNLMHAALKTNDNGINLEQAIPPDARDEIIEAAGQLRNSLADDIHARRAPWI